MSSLQRSQKTHIGWQELPHCLWPMARLLPELIFISFYDKSIRTFLLRSFISLYWTGAGSWDPAGLAGRGGDLPLPQQTHDEGGEQQHQSFHHLVLISTCSGQDWRSPLVASRLWILVPEWLYVSRYTI
jgi:hypothetical protein